MNRSFLLQTKTATRWFIHWLLCCGWRCETTRCNPFLKATRVKPVTVSHPSIWLFDLSWLAELHITDFPSHQSCTKQEADPSLWSTGVRHSVSEFLRISPRQASRPFLLLQSAYWRPSPGTGTEALTNIKAVSSCGFVKCLEQRSRRPQLLYGQREEQRDSKSISAPRLKHNNQWLSKHCSSIRHLLLYLMRDCSGLTVWVWTENIFSSEWHQKVAFTVFYVTSGQNMSP